MKTERTFWVALLSDGGFDVARSKWDVLRRNHGYFITVKKVRAFSNKQARKIAEPLVALHNEIVKLRRELV